MHYTFTSKPSVSAWYLSCCSLFNRVWSTPHCSTGPLLLVHLVFLEIWQITKFGRLKKTGLVQSCEVSKYCTQCVYGILGFNVPLHVLTVLVCMVFCVCKCTAQPLKANVNAVWQTLQYSLQGFIVQYPNRPLLASEIWLKLAQRLLVNKSVGTESVWQMAVGSTYTDINNAIILWFSTKIAACCCCGLTPVNDR